MATVLLATCAELPQGDEDAPLLGTALRAAGIDSSWARWDDPAVDWARADLVVVRSTWDYTARREEFLAWAATVPNLHNDAEILAWNTDKRYLLDLAVSGVPITPTWVLADATSAKLPEAGRVVIKPSVGAGSKGAGLFDVADTEGIAGHVRALLDAGLTPLLQPYLESVDARGETDCVFFDGEFSHAVCKGAMLLATADDPSGLFVAEQISPRVPSEEELEVATWAVRAAQGYLGRTAPPLYCRVDLVEGSDGPVVLELELTEPSLFLGHDAAASSRLSAAIAARL